MQKENKIFNFKILWNMFNKALVNISNTNEKLIEQYNQNKIFQIKKLKEMADFEILIIIENIILVNS